MTVAVSMRQERLGSVTDVGRMMIHAAYPSAHVTLCGRPTEGHPRGRLKLTCVVCAETATIWNRIDRGGG